MEFMNLNMSSLCFRVNTCTRSHCGERLGKQLVKENDTETNPQALRKKVQVLLCIVAVVHARRVRKSEVDRGRER